MSKPVVAWDVDCVLTDFIGPFVGAINEGMRHSHGADARQFTVEDVDNYDVYKALGVPEWVQEQANEAVASPGFCAGLEPYPRARFVVDALREHAEVIAVTSPWDSDFWMREREQWLVEKLGFSRKQIIFADMKHLIDADALVDDKTATIVKFAEHRRGLGILLDQPWNCVDVIPSRAKRALDLDDALRIISRHLRLPEKPVETGWLVEYGESPAMWWTGTCWTTDASAALRFARERDAIAYMRSGFFGPRARVTEHQWVDA